MSNQLNSNDLFPIITDRSRIEDYWRCPRRRWWQYEYLNQHRIEVETGGVVSNGISMYLLTGIGVHAAMEVLGKAAMGQQPGWRPTVADLDLAATAAKTAYYDALRGRSILIGPKASDAAREYTTLEQATLVEGFTYMLGLYLLPSIVTHYEIVEVEQEGLVKVDPEQLGVWLQFKPDALLRGRNTGDYHTLSLKTAGEKDWYTDYQFDRDLQGVTEPWGTTKRLTAAGKLDRQVSGAQMLYLVKGKRYEDKVAADGRKITYSPLLRAYKLPGPTIHEDQWAWSNETEKKNKDGEIYNGKLGKDWKAVQIWDKKEGFPGGVREWVRYLIAGKGQPEGKDPFTASWYMPQPQMDRDSELVERRLLSLVVQEREVANHSRHINWFLQHGGMSIEDPMIQRMLDVAFPMQTKGCYAMGGTCEYDPLCFGGQGQGVLQIKLQTDFQPREPHHQRLEMYTDSNAKAG